MTPPRLLVAVAFFTSGCALIQDDCEQLCDNLSTALAACADQSWGWADLGAGGRLAYARGCRSQWANQQVVLISRDLELALNECQDGQDVLRTLSCEQLLEMYVPNHTGSTAQTDSDPPFDSDTTP